jgi:hypothetical protein
VEAAQQLLDTASSGSALSRLARCCEDCTADAGAPGMKNLQRSINVSFGKHVGLPLYVPFCPLSPAGLLNPICWRHNAAMACHNRCRDVLFVWMQYIVR